VVVGLVAQQHAVYMGAAGLQVADDLRVRVEHLQALVGRHPGVELAPGVHRDDDLDAGRVGDGLVLLTEGGGDVHDAGALVGADVVGGQHPVRVRPPGEEVERRGVAQLDQLGATQRAQHGRLLAQLAGVVPDPGRGQHVPLSVRLDQRVLDVRVHGERQVGRQRPRRRGPDQRQRTVQIGLRSVQAEADRDRRVLSVQVDVVHLGLGGRQRGAVVPAVPEHPESGVDQALVPERLEGPHDAFHVVQVERLVVVLEVHPAGLPGDVGLPLVGVAQHRAAAGVVERGHAHLVDLGLVLDPQLVLRLGLGGQPVGVPAEPALDVPPAHGLVARHHVLDVAGEQVPVVRQAVGERRAVVEDELVAAVLAGRALLDRGLEGAVGRPEVQHLALQRRERRMGGDGRVAVGRHGGEAPRAAWVVRPARGRHPGRMPRYHPACHRCCWRPLIGRL
jgi:hypothetical protein